MEHQQRPSREEGIFSHSKYYIHKIAKGEDVKQNLSNIRRYCQTMDYEKSIYDFYLLYWAWDDLDYGNATQSYWPEADNTNIERITIETAKKWLAENEKHYAQHKL